MRVLERGDSSLIDYCICDTGLNIRSLIRSENKYEILGLNEFPFVDVEYLSARDKQEDLFKKIYAFLIDLLSPIHILSVFDNLKNLNLYEFILSDPKFKSMFITSLEM